MTLAKVVSATEHIADGPDGIILESMFEGMAEYYSAELSEKIHRGQKDNALKGLNNGGSVPLGYMLNKQTQRLDIDSTTAPIVQEIFRCYAEGDTIKSGMTDAGNAHYASGSAGMTGGMAGHFVPLRVSVAFRA